MAILKHIASKNADYTEPERYLIFRHDEQTGKITLDEDGYPMLRARYILEGINCDPAAFARECNKANKQFKKNKGKNEIKTHHYILSFDPKDRALGLTMEQAQRMGMEFAQKHFPGHQILVCAHEDGHHGSGNIHVHIVLNSLRILDVPELLYEMRSCDTKAGYKHHCSKAYLNFLQDAVMQMCREHGLNQVDLKHSNARVTDAEYHAKQRGQRQLDRANEERAAQGLPTSQTKFEMEKEKIRAAILDTITCSADAEEFKKKLLAMYGIQVKESRGRWSYLPPGRKKPITGRKLGDAFEKAAVEQAILSAEPLTFVHGEQKWNLPILAGTENIGRLIDIDHSAKAQESEGYAHWAKLHNLQEQSKTFNYLTENGLLDSAKLDQDLADLSAAYQQSKAELKATETRLKDVNRKLRLLGQYFKTKAVYREYLKGGKRKDFAAAHRSELELYDAVVKELRELFGDQKLPSVQSLKQEKVQLTERKQAQYESYSALRSQWLELSKLARNRDSIAGQAIMSERNSKKRTI